MDVMEIDVTNVSDEDFQSVVPTLENLLEKLGEIPGVVVRVTDCEGTVEAVSRGTREQS